MYNVVHGFEFLCSLQGDEDSDIPEFKICAEFPFRKILGNREEKKVHPAHFEWYLMCGDGTQKAKIPFISC